MTENQLISLIARHLSEELTKEEIVELKQWAGANLENQLLLNRITNEEELEKELNRWRGIDAAAAFDKWIAHRRARRKAGIQRVIGWTVAASLLIAVAVIGLTRKTVQKEQSSAPVVAKVSSSVLPGRNTATLTLSNGHEILLDSAGNGDLAKQGNARLVKLDSGSLSYVVSGSGKNEPLTYNTLTTPRSGQYQLKLPDGSRVWLNNVSSLRYPTSFPEKNRIVELTGEAYFEIAKEVARPFIVKVKGEDVEVLGTSFNIMAYPDEASIQTTLLTGSVRVKAGSAAVQLKPDEQTQLGETGSLKVLKNVPSQDIVSWKDGFFYFGRASFKTMMRQLARWYNVEVVYEGMVPDMEFAGKIDRNLSLNELLKFLDKNHVHFRLAGRKLIVLPS